MKIWLMIGIVFVVLALMKLYIFSVLCHTFVFSKHKIVLALLLFGLYTTELAFFFLATKQGFSHSVYIALSSSIILAYSLFAACLGGDVSLRAGRFLLHTLDSGIKSKLESRLNSNSVLNPERRRFLKIMLDLGIVVLFLLFSFKGARNALCVPKVRNVEVRLKGLARDMNIAMVSDVHIGKMLQSEFVLGLVEKINALNADIVVIVGDLVDENIEFVKEHLLLLNGLQSKEGVYYVNGNHEYYHGIDSIMRFLKTLKLKVLENKSVELEGVNLCGVNDLAGVNFAHRPPDLETAKRGCNPNKPSILLAHQPKFVRRNDVRDFDLVLCGHTHAGQVFPLSIFVWLDQHYIHGLYKLDSKTQLYVSSGAGFWGPAIRFLAPSEIVNLTLKPQNA